MALKNDYLIPVGLFPKMRGYVQGHISFKKFLGEVLNWLHVPYSNDCCDAQSDSRPVRYNIPTGRLEYFSVTGWVNVPDAALANYVAPTTTTTTTLAPTTTTTTTVTP